MTSIERRLIVAAVLATVVVRIAMLTLPSTPLRTMTIESIADAVEYEQLARNIARNQVFSRDSVPPVRPELFRTPGYPMLIAPFYRFVRDPVILILLLQLLLSIMLVWAVRRFGLELGLSRATAGIAALLAGLSPNLAFLSTKVVTETAFVLLLTVCLLLFNRYRRTGGVSYLVGAGFCSGLMVLTRPIAILFPLLLAGHVLFRQLRAGRFRPVQLLVPLACASIVALPWVMRNGRTSGRYIVSTAGEHNTFLYNAATVLAADKNISLADARDTMRLEAVNRFGRLDTSDEAGFWRKLSAVAWPHMLRRPLLTTAIQLAGCGACFLSPISLQPLMVHSGTRDTGEPRVFQRSMALAARGKFGPAIRLVYNQRLKGFGAFPLTVLILAALFQFGVLMFGVIGVFSGVGRSCRWLLLSVLYFTLLVGPVGEARFRAPIEPVLILFAAVGLVRFCRARRKNP